MKKIKGTSYPLSRAVLLVEAISRDLASQLLKVLGARHPMKVYI